MEKKKKELILVGILVPVLIFVIYNTVSSVSSRKSSPPGPAVAPASAGGAAAVPPSFPRSGPEDTGVADDKVIAMQGAIAEGPWERDPFRPPPRRESEADGQDWKNFQLSGIISGRMAIINGEPIAPGEEYQGYRLREVEQYRIILEKDDESFILTLAEE